MTTARTLDAAMLAGLTTTFHGNVFTHVPADGTPDVRALAAPGSPRDRWSVPGPRTVYVGSDPSVSLGELARHHETGSTSARRLLRLRIRVDELLDLRDPEVLTALGVRGAPVAFLHRPLALRIGSLTRASGSCRGLIVPSMAFLDDPTRHGLVLFDERIPGGFSNAVSTIAVVGRVGILA